jgi:hypothetical protein
VARKQSVPKAKKVTQKTVTDWIFQNYEITLLPKYFYINLSKIAKGEYKGLAKPVPWADLLDMWQRKWSYLEKVHIKNEQQGKRIEGMARINYDLAIVLSKYDSYLKWKAESEAEQKKIIEEHNESNKIDYSNIKSKASDYTRIGVPKAMYEISDIDMNELLDEVYIGLDNEGDSNGN